MHFLQNVGGKHLSGYVIITEPDKPTIEAETISCVHCQFTWIVQPGSGRRRGFCFRCNGPTCGKKKCTDKCAPWEMQMEIVEGKKRFWQQMARAVTEQVLREKFTPSISDRRASNGLYTS